MQFPKPYEESRPWGKFRQFTHNETSTVKIIAVKQGERNSLQAHTMRDELWIIVAGEMLLTIGEEELTGKVGDEFQIPHGTKHRFKGLAADNRLLEISFGNFDESDNERFEDDYGRA